MKAFVISKVREKIGKNGKKFQKMANLEEEIGRFCNCSLWTTGEKKRQCYCRHHQLLLYTVTDNLSEILTS